MSHSRSPRELGWVFKPEYQALGYENAMTKEQIAKVHARFKACRDADHLTREYNTQRGYHETWCTTCGYYWQCDSSD